MFYSVFTATLRKSTTSIFWSGAGEHTYDLRINANVG